jgi:hypothetical protein
MTTPDPGFVALRTIGATLTELPFTVAAGTTPWAASIWPAANETGWGRELWRYDPTRRGWTIPPSCAHATIIELATATPATRRQPARTHTAWYGVAIAHDQHWLVSVGPFTHPADAAHHARQLTDQHRRNIVDRYRVDNAATR